VIFPVGVVTPRSAPSTPCRSRGFVIIESRDAADDDPDVHSSYPLGVYLRGCWAQDPPYLSVSSLVAWPRHAPPTLMVLDTCGGSARRAISDKGGAAGPWESPWPSLFVRCC